MPDSPRLEYEQRLDARRTTAAQWEGRARVLGHTRLAVFVAALAVGWVGLATEAVAFAWVAVPIAAFVWLVVQHDEAKREGERARRAESYHALGLARIGHRYAELPARGERFAGEPHPYAGHLDLFGPRSLFTVLSGAQTRAGEDALARWLLEPADAEEVRTRHAAVDELRVRLDFREDLAVLGPEVGEHIHPDALAAWGNAPPVFDSRKLRFVALALAIAFIAASAAAIFTPIGILPLLAVVAAELAFALPLRARVHGVISERHRPEHDLALLAELLGRVERERFSCTRLAELRTSLDTDGLPPSAQIARLRGYIRLLEARQNQIFAPLAPFLLWTTQVAFAVEAWRAECGPELAGWIDTIGQVEAFADLARYAYESPEDPFPELVEDGPLFDAAKLGHPLLPRDRCIPNDVKLDTGNALLIVSGSNMSGKSTLLRSVGTNVVLALAGAPVRARRLRLSALALGPSLRIQDSLEDGTSRFYAEIQCVREIVDRADGPTPVLFLLDEILAGTNSHDRGIGAAAVVRGLIARGAIGLITTHDLALTKIADELAPRARNVHLEDQLVNGEMQFDYQLREGVVTKSNALELMRAIGLEV